MIKHSVTITWSADAGASVSYRPWTTEWIEQLARNLTANGASDVQIYEADAQVLPDVDDPRRGTLLHALAYQERLLERYSKLANSTEDPPSTHNKLPRSEYQRIADRTAQEIHRIKQQLAAIDRQPQMEI